jgi:hypothetical protein
MPGRLCDEPLTYCEPHSRLCAEPLMYWAEPYVRALMCWARYVGRLRPLMSGAVSCMSPLCEPPPFAWEARTMCQRSLQQKGPEQLSGPSRLVE